MASTRSSPSGRPATGGTRAPRATASPARSTRPAARTGPSRAPRPASGRDREPPPYVDEPGGRRRTRPAPPSRRRRWAARIRRLAFICLLLLVAGIGGLGYLFASVPLPPEAPPLEQTSFLCAADVASGCDANNSMAQFTGGVDREIVTYEQLPTVLIHAVLAAEDRDFFAHGGVDPTAVVRALWADVREGGVSQGGSTITQQYIKIALLEDTSRSLDRKVREAVMAVKLEKELSKQEILLRYLNTIYFGRGAYGVGAAARVYFGKHVEDLELHEAAYLAGLIRAPEKADGNRGDDTDPEAAQQRKEAARRRLTVLDAMLEEGYVTADEHAAADAVPFTCDAFWGGPCFIRPRREITNWGDVRFREMGSEYFIEYVRKFLTTEAGFTDGEIYGGGLRIYTTFDPGMQDRAFEAIQSTLGREGDPQASLVAIDPDGRVRAMVGCWDPLNCRDPEQYAKEQVNLATGRLGGGSGRQPGSIFKPFALAEALKQGVGLDTIVDSPSSKTFPGADDGKDWNVKSVSGEGAEGKMTLFDATRLSSNTAYAQLILDVGVANVAELSQRMGISADVPEFPSIVLGTALVSVLDMTEAYSTFMNTGEHVNATPVVRVTDAQGNILWEPSGDRERVLPIEVAEQVTWTLNSVIKSGTGTGANLGHPAAGKTGTTQEHTNAWFAGYHCTMTAVVWMGDARTSQPMTDVHGIRVLGGKFPATIWKKFMEGVTEGAEECPYDRKPESAPKSLSGSSGSSSKKPKSTTTAPKATTTTAKPAATTTTAAPTTTRPPTTTVAPTTAVPAVPAGDP
jgi:membrane peptidoglycan carboxypeptidase